ncbi:MAG: hypothetical protein PHI44_03225, partial [Candidatus Ratteibacteria bacterium]|nr:hypothetical protein [Candidatus Ratteibacteria bacterium]
MRKRYVVYVVIIGLSLSVYGAQDYSVILKRNIFAEPAPKPQIVPEKTPILKPAPPPSLSSLINLLGVVYFSDGGSYIILNSKGKNEEVVLQEGDIIENATVLKIESDGVVFFYDGKEEKIALKQGDTEGMMVSVAPGLAVKLNEGQDTEAKKEDEPGGQIVNPSYALVPEFTEPVFVDINKALNEIRNDKELFKKLNVTPKLNGGKVDGFEVNNLPQDSLPYKYGLRDGDVVRRVN